MKIHSHIKKVLIGILVFFGIVTAATVAVAAVTNGRIRAQTAVGSIAVGRLTPVVAREKIHARVATLQDQGFAVVVDGERFRLYPDRLGIIFLADDAIERAWKVGRSGPLSTRLRDWFHPLVGQTVLLVTTDIDERLFASELDAFVSGKEEPGRDIRLSFSGAVVSAHYDTKLGRELPREELIQAIRQAAAALSTEPIVISRATTAPQISKETVAAAQAGAERILAKPVTLRFEARRFTLSPERLATFLTSDAVGSTLTVGVNERAVSAYVTEIAQALNTAAQDPILVVKDGKVISFTAPRPGRVLEETQTIGVITEGLLARRDGKDVVVEITLPVTVREPVAIGSANDLGIHELIGRASTTFTGSPPNRRVNIKNGTKFLTGILIKPGEEFSTVGALGEIDNTTGYLPELVIKGDRTIPEFGGGLCQVSTTLFRAVLNAGLPVTARRNHSYRVGYYERDANGNYIGPGLDATIYQPNPDFKFTNDTANTILISGYTEGDILTFEFYGTKDGRSSVVDGPHTLSTTPAGKTIIVETDEIPVGERRRLETAHPGGSAKATYAVTYADGRKVSQTFLSSYRPWPERWIVGVAPIAAVPPTSEVVPVEPVPAL